MRLSTSLRLNAQKGLVTPYDPALTLDLQFAARQAYVANIGPLPTFTRASIGTFVGSDGLIQTAGTNVPRIDFDPVTRLCRGLLIEEQRTNSQSRSEEFGNASWAKGAVTVTDNSSTAPDGATTADLISETATSAQHSVFQGSPAGVTTGTVYTASVFVKKGTGATAPDWIQLGFLTGGFGVVRAAFNVSTGLFGNTTGSPSTSVTAYQNGWYRISITGTATATAAWGTLVLAFTNNANVSASVPTYTGQTTSDVFVWGAQFEAGAFATSYIPTTTGSLIRSADVCSITGAAFTGFYNQTEGTLVFKGSKPSVQASGTAYVSVDDNTANERLFLFYSASEYLFVTDGGVTQVSMPSGVSVAVNTRFGIAARYKANDFALSVSGGAVGTDVAGTVPSVSQMTIGSRMTTTTNIWVESIQYYNTIKTNAELQALSTP
jgi:hypothetical protein